MYIYNIYIYIYLYVYIYIYIYIACAVSVYAVCVCYSACNDVLFGVSNERKRDRAGGLGVSKSIRTEIEWALVDVIDLDLDLRRK